MFCKLLLILTICSLALGAPKLRKTFRSRNIPNGRIVGGRDAEIEEFPHQASLEWYGWHICGAVIVSEKYVITAAHCTDDSAPRELKIRVGSSIAETGGRITDVLAIFQHPQYDYIELDYDISIVEVPPLDFSSTVSPIGLPAGPEVPHGTEVQVSGWGIIGEDADDISYQLQVVEVNIVGLEECRIAYINEYLTERMLCAGVDGGGKDACSGDSGGPLIANDTVYGIVSWGYGCARPEYPGVYSSVVGLRDYIAQITQL